MKNFDKKFVIRWSTVILTVYLLICLSLFYFTFIGETSEEIENIIGGAFVTMIAVMIQFLASWEDHRNSEFLKKNGVINFLDRRDDKIYYRGLVDSADEYINMMFYTARRFVDDFCSTVDGDNSLILALSRGVEVKLLVASETQIDKSEIADLEKTIEKLRSLKQKYNYPISVRKYNNQPAHNIFSTEVDTVVGPYFHPKERRYNHSIHLYTRAKFTKGYLNYFNDVWDKSTPCF
jgi:hypothetical protein